jgi:hypothetical protein
MPILGRRRINSPCVSWLDCCLFLSFIFFLKFFFFGFGLVRHLGKIRSIFLLIDFTNRWRCCDILCNWGRPGPIPRRRIPVQGEEVRGKKCTRGLSVCGGGYDPLWVDGGGRQKRLRRRRRRSQRVRATRSPLSSTVLGGPLVSYTTQKPPPDQTLKQTSIERNSNDSISEHREMTSV